MSLHAIEIKSFLSSSNIVKGEYTTFYIETKKELKSLPTIKSHRYTAELYDISRTRNKLGNTVYHHKYKISSLITGSHEIPKLTLQIKKKKYTTNPHTFHVFSADALTFQTLKVKGEDLTFATKMFLPKKELYLGENVCAELKVYLPSTPSTFQIIDQGLSDQKRHGMSAWTFQPSTNESIKDTLPFLLPSGSSYALSYSSSVHAIQEGEVSLGPGNVTPIFKFLEPSGIATWREITIPLPVEAIKRTALALPTPAPKTFDGAVGKYTIDVKALNPDISSPSDPITIKLTVSGSGNLNEIEAPKPIFTPNSWRVYPAIKKQRDEERKYLSGSVEFEQIIRPTSEQSFIPVYKFSYFDPETKSYITLESDPIPLSFKTRVAANLQKDTLPSTFPNKQKNKQNSTAPSSAANLTTPDEKMEGVLDFIPPKAPQKTSNLAYISWHLFPALVSLYLFWLFFKKHLLKRLIPHPKKIAASRTLQRLHKMQDPILFIKKAAFFAKTYLPKNKELRAEIEELRNNSCYLPEKDRTLITEDVRKKILTNLSKALKHTTFLLLLCTVLSTPKVSASEHVDTLKSPKELEQTAYAFTQEGNYLAAISTYLNMPPHDSADALYNIGTCYANLQQPGLAMLYYKRAIIIDPDHPESLQNLTYLIGKHNPILPKKKDLYQRFLAIPRKLSSRLSWIGMWTFLITLLIFSLLEHRRFSVLIYIILTSSLILTSSMRLSMFLATQTRTLLKRTPFILVTSPETVTLKTSASHSGSNVIKAAPGSLGKVLEQRGLWLYVELANHTRGWLNAQHVSSLTHHQNTIYPVPTVNNSSDL